MPFERMGRMNEKLPASYEASPGVCSAVAGSHGARACNAALQRGSLTLHSRSKRCFTFEQVAKIFPGNFFNMNPVHCLRSRPLGHCRCLRLLAFAAVCTWYSSVQHCRRRAGSQSRPEVPSQSSTPMHLLPDRQGLLVLLVLFFVLLAGMCPQQSVQCDFRWACIHRACLKHV